MLHFGDSSSHTERVEGGGPKAGSPQGDGGTGSAAAAGTDAAPSPRPARRSLPFPLQTVLWLVKRERWRGSEQQQSLLGRGTGNLPGTETSGWDVAARNDPDGESTPGSVPRWARAACCQHAGCELVPGSWPGGSGRRQPSCRSSRQGHGERSPAPGQATRCPHPAPSSATASQRGLGHLPASSTPSHRPALPLGTCLRGAAGSGSLPGLSQPSWDERRSRGEACNKPHKERNPFVGSPGSRCLGGKETFGTKRARDLPGFAGVIPLFFLWAGEGSIALPGLLGWGIHPAHGAALLGAHLALSGIRTSHEPGWHCRCPGPLCPFHTASPWRRAELLPGLAEPPGRRRCFLGPPNAGMLRSHSHGMSLGTRSCPESFPQTRWPRGGRGRIRRGLTTPQAPAEGYPAQALGATSITLAFPSEFSARRGAMGAPRRAGAQAGGCSAPVPPKG